MGLIIDTDVLILAEKNRIKMDFDRFQQFSTATVSTITISELLVGVYRATNPDIRAKRLAFVESIISCLPILDIDLETARVHAEIVSQIPKNQTVGAHDVLIAATAVKYGYPVLTQNGNDFRKIPGVQVIDYFIST